MKKLNRKQLRRMILNELEGKPPLYDFGKKAREDLAQKTGGIRFQPSDRDKKMLEAWVASDNWFAFFGWAVRQALLDLKSSNRIWHDKKYRDDLIKAWKSGKNFADSYIKFFQKQLEYYPDAKLPGK